MKVPYLHDTVLEALSPVAVKVLIEFCGHLTDGASKGTVTESAKRLHVSERSWRRATTELSEAGLIEYAVSCDGYRARPKIGTRFTWLPSFNDERLRLATPRCCKVLVAVCRAVHNATRSIRMRIKTIAQRIGRSARTVQLALHELAERCILDAHRTGRSNWFCVRSPEPDPQLFDQPPEVAHRAGLLLRLLSSSTPECLSRVFQRRRFEPETEKRIRSQWISPRGLDPTRRGLVRQMRRFGVKPDEANVYALMYTPDEVHVALELAVGRRTEDPTGWFRRALSKVTT
jgi:Mn-dependent DtxR family transcriptional regulator